MEVDFSKVKIFVEGADRVFIRDIIKLWYTPSLTQQQIKELVTECGGFTNIEKHIDEFEQINERKKREGGINIVIFDADYASSGEANHGYNNKITYLNARKKELGINFETYLFPNNENDGTIETLLETCIHPGHQGIMECWHEFESCVRGKGDYTIPAGKSKIYLYLECLHGNTKKEKDKIKDPNRDFTLADKWVMDYNQNPALAKLKIFLDNNLQQYSR